MYNDALGQKENAKSGLIPQDNIVRIIDDPHFSTAPEYRGAILFSLIGFAISIVVVIIPLIMRKAILDGREEDKLNAQKLAAQNEETASTIN